MGPNFRPLCSSLFAQNGPRPMYRGVSYSNHESNFGIIFNAVIPDNVAYSPSLESDSGEELQYLDATEWCAHGRVFRIPDLLDCKYRIILICCCCIFLYVDRRPSAAWP